MTIWDLLTAVRRHWALALAVVLAVGLAAGLAARPVHVYVGKVRVIFLAPETYPGNVLAATSRSIIDLAGVVARDVNGFGDPPQPTDPTLTLASQGIRVGVSVRQPNAGGQWDTLYEEPVLDIQSTAPTLEEARTLINQTVDRVEASLTRLQDEEGVPADLRVRTRSSPEEPSFSVQSGSRVRAAAAVVLIGAIAGAILLVTVSEHDERRLRGPRHPGARYPSRRAPRRARADGP